MLSINALKYGAEFGYYLIAAAISLVTTSINFLLLIKHRQRTFGLGACYFLVVTISTIILEVWRLATVFLISPVGIESFWILKLLFFIFSTQLMLFPIYHHHLLNIHRIQKYYIPFVVLYGVSVALILSPFTFGPSMKIQSGYYLLVGSMVASMALFQWMGYRFWKQSPLQNQKMVKQLLMIRPFLTIALIMDGLTIAGMLNAYEWPIQLFFTPAVLIVICIYFLINFTEYLIGKEKNIVSSDNLNRFFMANPVSEREREVITLLIKNLSNRQIGEQLFISEKTVKRHMANIFEKLHISNRNELIFKIWFGTD